MMSEKCRFDTDNDGNCQYHRNGCPDPAPKAAPLGFGTPAMWKDTDGTKHHSMVVKTFNWNSFDSAEIIFPNGAKRVVLVEDLERILPPDVSAELSAHKDLLDHVENSGLCSAPRDLIEASREAIERYENGRIGGLPPDVRELLDEIATLKAENANVWKMLMSIISHDNAELAVARLKAENESLKRRLECSE
jgi:hypothetical protein